MFDWPMTIGRVNIENVFKIFKMGEGFYIVLMHLLTPLLELRWLMLL